MRGAGRAMFVAILLVVAGTLNVVYGIAAAADGDFFAGDTVHAFASVETWGWITLLLGIIQVTGGFSLAVGHAYGLVIGLTAATLGAIESLLAVGGAHPFWALGVFALCIIVIHGLVVYGEAEDRVRPTT
jgi:hypothetical protein